MVGPAGRDGTFWLSSCTLAWPGARDGASVFGAAPLRQVYCRQGQDIALMQLGRDAGVVRVGKGGGTVRYLAVVTEHTARRRAVPAEGG